MRRKALIYCEVCGGTTRSGAPDYLIFHCLAFCSPDCLDDYKAADAERRAKEQTPAAGRSVTARRKKIGRAYGGRSAGCDDTGAATTAPG